MFENQDFLNPQVTISNNNQAISSANLVIARNLAQQPITRSNTIDKYGKIAVLLLACNRPSISRALDSIFRYKKQDHFPVIVSQDCQHDETGKAIDLYSDKILHLKQPDVNPPEIDKGHENLRAYYSISRHYKWAMEQIFDILMFEQVIILEDDMEISPDFFDYFQAFLPLLREDKSLFCVSSWNDNGKANKVADEHSFYRSDFFPGLGWMMTQSLWNELKVKWPKAFWDDWLRLPENRNGRSCIRPEISRSSNFGKIGASGGQYFDQHIATVMKNTLPVTFSSSNSVKEKHTVDVLLYQKEIYDDRFMKQVYQLSTQITSDDLKQLLSQDFSALKANIAYAQNKNMIEAEYLKSKLTDDVNSVYYCGRHCLKRFVIFYVQDEKWQNFVQAATKWNLMNDIRAGQARTAYQGIICWKEKLKEPHKQDLKDENGRWILSDEVESFVSVCLAPLPNLKGFP